MTIQDRLLALRDEQYAAFTAKLIPNIDPSAIIGVRSPQIKQLVKTLKGSPEAADFMLALPHRYLEENGLHAALLCEEKDYAIALAAVDRFLPFVDNWGTCDSLSPRAFAHHTDALLPEVRRWIADPAEYTIRFGIGMLMRYYLDDSLFHEQHLQWVGGIDRQEYYIRMMQAWYLATALAKQPAAALPYLAQQPIDPLVRRKTIQKALESYRVSDEVKAQLRQLRKAAINPCSD